MTKFLRAKGVLESLSMLLPVTLFYLVWILMNMVVLAQTSPPSLYTLLWILPGYLSWTLFEYLGHRYIEHRPMVGKKVPAWVVAWSAHAEHHNHTEVLDDVFDLYQSGIIVLGAAALFMFLSGNMVTTCALHTGFILGYLGYEWIHIGGHCPVLGKTKLFDFLSRNHQRHHHINETGFYGTSGPLWDIVFRTYR
ncbi:MAG: hypothetical protein CMH60_05375 [Myxococcales bacterium]|nr:hypothetical protein [Myxococcales bacterium]